MVLHLLPVVEYVLKLAQHWKNLCHQFVDLKSWLCFLMERGRNKVRMKASILFHEPANQISSGS